MVIQIKLNQTIKRMNTKLFNNSFGVSVKGNGNNNNEMMIMDCNTCCIFVIYHVLMLL